MRKILGIDPGFGRIGFGCILIKPGQIQTLDYGVITTDAAFDFEMRLFDMAHDFEELLETHHPDLVSIEKLFFAKNTKTAMQVAEARGVILYLCAKHSIKMTEFTPAQIKIAVTGDGSADKQAIQMMITKLLNLKQTPKIDDAADALAAALTASSIRW